MNIDIFWGNPEKTIIQMDLNPGWEWNELGQTTAQTYIEMMESVDYRVHLIINVKSANLPPNVLSNWSRLMYVTHPREDKTVMVGHLHFVKTVLDILGRVSALRKYVSSYMMADTIEAAYEKLGSSYSPVTRVIPEETQIQSAQ